MSKILLVITKPIIILITSAGWCVVDSFYFLIQINSLKVERLISRKVYETFWLFCELFIFTFLLFVCFFYLNILNFFFIFFLKFFFIFLLFFFFFFFTFWLFVWLFRDFFQSCIRFFFIWVTTRSKSVAIHGSEVKQIPPNDKTDSQLPS